MVWRGRGTTLTTADYPNSNGTVDDIPFLLEDELQQAGGQYEKAENWAPKVVVDGKLYTGQNPASAQPLAERVKKDLLAA
jgi:putative intracellular protease/amidase